MCLHQVNSGVAVLSCTDCSGSSTASSDITDPGSPYSTASTHSEDSGTHSQTGSTKMPPTQTAHLPPWPWSAMEEGTAPTMTSASPTSTSSKRPSSSPIADCANSDSNTATAFSKRIKSSSSAQSQPQSPSSGFVSSAEHPPQHTPSPATPNSCSKQSPPCLNNALMLSSNHNNNNNSPSLDKPVVSSKSRKGRQEQQQQKQGKITEYFKSQVKLHVISSKKESAKLVGSNNGSRVVVDQQTQFNGVRAGGVTRGAAGRKAAQEQAAKNGRKHHVTVPRKILPAPSKMAHRQDNNMHHHASQHHHHQQQQQQQHHNIASLAPTVTLTAVSFPTYLHTKVPKPPDVSSPPPSIFMPQFATIAGDKLGSIPACLNVIHQPAAIANFNCVKLNATVVPIVKLNTLPPRLSVPPPPQTTTPSAAACLSLETAVPTVLSAKPAAASGVAATSTPKQHATATEVKCVSTAAAAPKAQGEASPSADSDSGVSLREHLEVAVAETLLTTVPPQKSPILSQPRTIRFPAKVEVRDDGNGAKATHSSESGMCRWAECSAQFDTSGALLEHLQVKHVISQATQEHYVCLWLGCKVHGRTSCSRSWLERHVLAHAGTKPFRCIVDGCGQRFNSQLSLERHVNGHFNGDGSQNGSAKKSNDNSSAKLFKRNGKKIRMRRQPWSARMFDFFDVGVMEGLQHRLLTMTQDRTNGQAGTSGDTVNVFSQVMARRVETDGNTKFLVRWHPSDIVPDEWVSEKELTAMKSVRIPSQRSPAKDALNSFLFRQGAGQQERQPQQQRRGRKTQASKQKT